MSQANRRANANCLELGLPEAMRRKNRWWFNALPLLFNFLPCRNKAIKLCPLSDPLSMTDVISQHKLQPVYQPRQRVSRAERRVPSLSHTAGGKPPLSCAGDYTRRAHRPSLINPHTRGTCAWTITTNTKQKSHSFLTAISILKV